MTETLSFSRRVLLLGATALTAVVAIDAPASAQGAGGQIRRITLISAAQASDPQEFQAANLVAQAWRQLGLDVEVRGMPRPQLSDLVWRSRDRWDMTMWRMVGRPERSDPDELVYNLFHSSTAETGFNFVGYRNPAYDAVAEAQRRELDIARRRTLINEAQQLVMRDVPYFFLVYPQNVIAFNNQVIRRETVVDQAGIGQRNFWTFNGAEPLGTQRDLICNAAEALNAINPLYISGAIDSWVTDLVWDRLMRVGPDGLPRPWSAESVTTVNPTTIDVKMRPGLMWHDGRPVTLDDVIFSFQAPAGGEAPMYRPFVTNIAGMEKRGEDTVRFTLRAPSSSFQTATLAKVNLIPKHVWEPVLTRLASSPQNAESHQEVEPVGSGPWKVTRFRLQEEIVLERVPNHFAPPKFNRWILRVVTNTEASLGMLRRGEINFLSDYRGDPALLQNLMRQAPQLEMASAIDMGFRFVAPNLRRAPFDDVVFRRALMTAINRNLMVQAAWNGFAVAANSHVSAALTAWHLPEAHRANMQEARRLLEEAGYRVVNGRLHYPAGRQETLQPLQ